MCSKANDIKPDTENSSNRDNFNSAGNKESKCDERSLVAVCIKNFDLYFNP